MKTKIFKSFLILFIIYLINLGLIFALPTLIILLRIDPALFLVLQTIQLFIKRSVIIILLITITTGFIGLGIDIHLKNIPSYRTKYFVLISVIIISYAILSLIGIVPRIL